MSHVEQKVKKKIFNDRAAEYEKETKISQEADYNVQKRKGSHC